MPSIVDIVLKDDSLISSFPLLTQSAREKKIFLGSKFVGKFLIVDSFWKPLAQILNKPMRVRQIAYWLEKADPTNFPHGESISTVKIMILYMANNKLIHRIDEKVIYAPRKRHRNIFSRITPQVAKIFVSFPLSLVYILLGIVASLSPFLVNDLFPRASDFFWHERLSFSLLTYVAIGWLGISLHEFAHFLAARSQDISSRYRLSNRLNYLVVEALFPNIFAATPGWRIAISLAGIVADLAVLGLIFIALTLGSPTGWVLGLLKQAALITWVGVLWQFLFYMKTDIYFVIKELVRIENLYTYSKQKVLSWLRGKSFKPLLTPKEDRIVNVYSIFFVLGTIFGVIRFVLYHLPITITLIRDSIADFRQGIELRDSIKFFDGAIVLAVEVFFFMLLARIYFRKIRTWMGRI